MKLREYAEKLTAMTVRAQSPDDRVLGTFRGDDRIEVGFADHEAYYEYQEETALAHQISTLLNSMSQARADGSKALLREANGRDRDDDSHWNAKRRRFREERDGFLAEGKSHGGHVQISAIGLRNWTVSVSRGTFETMDEEQFLAEFDSAISEFWDDYAQELYLLKVEIYGNVGPKHTQVLAVAGQGRASKTSATMSVRKVRKSA